MVHTKKKKKKSLKYKIAWPIKPEVVFDMI